VLLGGVPGVQAADVVVLGGGVVGTNAACVGVGLGARVTVLDRFVRRLQDLDAQFGSKLNTIYAPTPRMSSMGWCITVSPICRAPSPVLPVTP
jgi:alanine dehydrogenase